MVGSRVIFFGLASLVGVGALAVLAAGCGGPPAHSGGMVIGSKADCVGCHQSNYDATSTPAHVTVGFPTTCADCHITTTWLGAVGKHSQAAEAVFPIGSGRHAGIACNACHDTTLAANYQTNANCTASECHNGAGQTARDHTKTDFLANHDNGPNTWSSHNGDTNKMFCLDCHQGGGGADGG